MSRRVVITGMGAVTPLGLNVDEFWNGLKEGRHGFGPITQFDASEYKCKVVGEVKGFVAKDYIDPKAARRMARFSQFAVAAAKEAVADAKLDMTAEDPYMVGTCVGSGVGSLQELESAYEKIMTKGPNRVSPFTVPMMISNIAAGNIAIQLGCKGKSIDVVTACASGTNSIGEAFRTIQYGDADVMIAGGTEAAVSRHLMHYQRCHHLITRTDAQFHLIKRETVSFLVKVPVSLFLRNWNMLRSVAQRSMQRSADTDAPVMHSISQHRKIQARALQEQC